MPPPHRALILLSLFTGLFSDTVGKSIAVGMMRFIRSRSVKYVEI